MAPVSWSSLRQWQHDSIRIQLLQGNPVPEYRNRQSRLHLLRRAGFSEELARNLQGDILESQRKYYGGYIHVGKRVFLENLDGFIFASGEDTPDAILDVFSISGKPVERLLLDRNGHCAVDEKGGRIFLFTYGDNPELFVYKL